MQGTHALAFGLDEVQKTFADEFEHGDERHRHAHAAFLDAKERSKAHELARIEAR